MNKFDTWYYSLLEDIETQDVQVKDNSTAKNETNIDNVTTERDVIINDVDTILKSLETLSSELKEDLDNAALEEEKNESKNYLLNRAEKLKAFDLYNEIQFKKDWQLVKGTKLRSIYESKLNLLENNLKLNENRYVTFSIKDKFSKLI